MDLISLIAMASWTVGSLSYSISWQIFAPHDSKPSIFRPIYTIAQENEQRIIMELPKEHNSPQSFKA
jgi:hypothetical protein